MRFFLFPASGLLLVLLGSCARAGSSSPPTNASGLSVEVRIPPSLSPFQPLNPSLTPSPEPSPSPTSTPTPGNTLRAAADRIGFGIGAAYQDDESRDPLFSSVFPSEFNTVMMKTFMKRIEPGSGVWDWSFPDRAFALASADGLKIIGGPLVYNDPNSPAWLMFDHPDCGAWNAAELEGMLQDYIDRVIAHFQQRVSAWEVMNEPLTSPDNCWRKVLGDGYIARAFRYARAADPHALLFLNEGFEWEGVDRSMTDQFFSLVKQLRGSGAPVDAVGIQMHLNAEILRPTYPDEFRYFLDQARETGVQVLITEMDVYQGSPGHFPDPLDVQQQIYQTITQVCLDYPYCTSLIVWGVSDRYTWLKHMYKNLLDPQPLLFDLQFVEKPAFFGVLEALQAARGAGGV